MSKARLLLPLVCAAALAVPASTSADLTSTVTSTATDPTSVLIDWSSLLPGLTDQYDPNSANICVSGHVECVDATIREMARRFGPLATTCNHNALFALLYLRVTQQYRLAVNDPNYFSDNAFVNHEDAVFAKYYFRAMDNYAAGNFAGVPAAWMTALDAASSRSVSGEGDLLLGVNAHVQRDLPFVLAAIGLVKPDGTSRKPDHDLVNQILYQAYEPAITEAAQRFDPSVNFTLPGPLQTASYQTFFQAVEAWREIAWRNAERLVSAPDPVTYAQVAQSIEDYAASQAQLIVADTAYTPPLSSTASRDAYCAVNHG
jgi:Family of unknown function (DUF5995)